MDKLCFKFGCSKTTTASSAVSSVDSLFINTGVKHLAQLTENDCGLACFKMALRYFCKNQDARELEQRLERTIDQLEIRDKSFWTIDIAHLCSLMSLDHQMFTKTFGVQETYAQEDFYAKDNLFETEKLRINEKFQNASRHGIKVKLEHIELDLIKTELKSTNCACIVLIDASLLNGQNFSLNEADQTEFVESLAKKMAENAAKSPAAASGLTKTTTGYLGHFIVLIGFDDTRKMVVYRNPSSDFAISFTSYENFERARLSFGTDEDILFIYGPPHPPRLSFK